MSSLEAHGGLEALLLLQGIQTYGTESPSLDTLSQALKSSKIITRHGSLGNENFAPNVLRTLYLRLLKDEVKLSSQKDGQSDPVQDEERHPHKRVLSSPPMETMEEASHFSHLIPHLATRVYNEFRDSTTSSIDAEERKYRLLQKDIEEIERGEWDARLQNQEATLHRDTKGMASIQTLLQNESDITQAPSKVPNGLHSSPLPSNHLKPPNQSAQTQDNPGQAVPIANGDSAGATTGSAGAAQQQSPPVAATSPPKPRQPFYPPYEQPVNAPRPSSQTGSTENGMPFLPPLQPVQQGYRRTSPPAELPRRQSSQQANIAPSPGTRPQQTPLPPPERSSGSPIILPPPPGMIRSTSSPSRPLDALADMAGQQYRPGAMLSPRPPQASNSIQHPVQLPLPSNYTHRPYQYPHYDNRTPYQNTYAPYHPSPLPAYPSQHHQHVAPYQYPAHTSGHSPHYAPRSQYHSPVPNYPQYSPYSNTPTYTPQGQMVPSYSQYQTPRPPDQQTPISTSNAMRRAPRPSPIITTGSATKWKNVESDGGRWPPKSPIRPDEISPLSDKAPSPVLGPMDVPTKTVVPEDRGLPTAESPVMPHTKPTTTKNRRGRPPRGTSTRGRGGRAASIASSVPRARTRSVSVVSGADELSLEPPTSAITHAIIKPEPPATPARDSSASIPPTANTDPEGNRKSTRRRRGTLRGLESTTDSIRTGTKRKRTIDTLELESRPTLRSQFEKQKDLLSKTHILASRNLTRTSATLINDITAHKFASIFAKPLTEREAPGYHSLIYRPQDLKSIKQALTMGNRALATIVEQETDNDGGERHTIPVAGASESDMRVWVKPNDDIVPPRGIVNSAQLEREIMRVFANAVMFNPDPNRDIGPAFRTRARQKERHVPIHLVEEEEVEDEVDDGYKEEEEGGVVKDAREMFEDVEKMVADWRAAEKTAEGAASMEKMVADWRAAGKVAEGAVNEKVGAGVGKAKSGEEEEADELAGEESGVVAEEKTGGAERAGKRRRR